MKTFLKKSAYPGYVTNTFFAILQSNLSMFTMFGFFNISSLICIEILDEKEKKLKVLLWIFKIAYFG